MMPILHFTSGKLQVTGTFMVQVHDNAQGGLSSQPTNDTAETVFSKRSLFLPMLPCAGHGPWCPPLDHMF